MKTICVVLIILGLLCSCQKSSLVPEITPNLAAKPVHNLEEKRRISQLGQFKTGLIFVTPKNEIQCFDPRTQTLDTIFQFGQPVEQRFFLDRHLLIIKNKKGPEWSILDLESKIILKTVQGFPADQIIGSGNQIICFQKNSRLIILDHQSLNLIHEIPLEAEKVFSCEFKGPEILILTSKKLYIYNREKNHLNSHSLQNLPASGFLLWDEHIYYGSINRELIKFALKTRKVKWKIKLAMILKVKPQQMGKFIVFSPEDNNIFFFKRNGTLHWWEKLEATRMLPPIIMRENVAVFLLNGDLKFVNPKARKVQKFSLKTSMDSNPVYLENYLYYLSHKKNKKVQKISRVGNIYQVKVKTYPKHVKPLGQSIQFNLNPINLVNPVLEVKILDQADLAVFQKTIKHGDIMSFVWIPKAAGKYKLVLEIKAKNKKQMTINQDVKITDIETMIRRCQEQNIFECPFDLFNAKSSSQ